VPFLRRIKFFIYRQLGATLEDNARISSGCTFLLDYENLIMKKNSEINKGCFLLLRDKFILGENSTLAYNVSIYTSANPNGPKNKLSKIYPKKQAPIIIGDNVWVGANSVILPGVTIGDYSVIAAGSVVNKDVPSGYLYGGVPSKMIKKLSE
jgi:acetyltransferase-like isoleucine patch superfamily enzyme